MNLKKRKKKEWKGDGEELFIRVKKRQGTENGEESGEQSMGQTFDGANSLYRSSTLD